MVNRRIKKKRPLRIYKDNKNKLFIRLDGEKYFLVDSSGDSIFQGANENEIAQALARIFTREGGLTGIKRAKKTRKQNKAKDTKDKLNLTSVGDFRQKYGRTGYRNGRPPYRRLPNRNELNITNRTYDEIITKLRDQLKQEKKAAEDREKQYLKIVDSIEERRKKESADYENQKNTLTSKVNALMEKIEESKGKVKEITKEIRRDIKKERVDELKSLKEKNEKTLENLNKKLEDLSKEESKIDKLSEEEKISFRKQLDEETKKFREARDETINKLTELWNSIVLAQSDANLNRLIERGEPDNDGVFPNPIKVKFKGSNITIRTVQEAEDFIRAGTNLLEGKERDLSKIEQELTKRDEELKKKIEIIEQSTYEKQKALAKQQMEFQDDVAKQTISGLISNLRAAENESVYKRDDLFGIAKKLNLLSNNEINNPKNKKIATKADLIGRITSFLGSNQGFDVVKDLISTGANSSDVIKFLSSLPEISKESEFMEPLSVISEKTEVSFEETPLGKEEPEEPEEPEKPEEPEEPEEPLQGKGLRGKPLKITPDAPRQGLGAQSDLYANENEKDIGQTDEELLTAAKDLDLDNFLGVFMADEFDKIIAAIDETEEDMPFSFIINTDTKKENTPETGHWVAVWVDPDDEEEINYFDPLGEPPSKEFLKGLKKIVAKINPAVYLKLKVNGIQHQSDDSDNCGWFALKFLLDRSMGMPFADSSGFSESETTKRGEETIEDFKKEFGFI